MKERTRSRTQEMNKVLGFQLEPKVVALVIGYWALLLLWVDTKVWVCGGIQGTEVGNIVSCREKGRVGGKGLQS